MKIERLFSVFIVMALITLSLASCVDSGLGHLEERIGKLETQVRLLEAQKSVLEARIDSKDNQIQELRDDLSQHNRKIDAFTILVTQHENDFYYLYKNLGWDGKDSFGNWENQSSLWEAAWGCTGSCSGPTVVLRNYEK